MATSIVYVLNFLEVWIYYCSPDYLLEDLVQSFNSTKL